MYFSVHIDVFFERGDFWIFIILLFCSYESSLVVVAKVTDVNEVFFVFKSQTERAIKTQTLINLRSALLSHFFSRKLIQLNVNCRARV